MPISARGLSEPGQGRPDSTTVFTTTRTTVTPPNTADAAGFGRISNPLAPLRTLQTKKFFCVPKCGLNAACVESVDPLGARGRITSCARMPGRSAGLAGRRASLSLSRPAPLFGLIFSAYLVGRVFSAAAFGVATASALSPAGLTVAALLLTRRSLWPVIVAAVVAAEFLVDLLGGMPLLRTVGFALASTVEPLVGAVLVRAWCGGSPDLRRTRELAVFVVGACVVAPLVGGVINGAFDFRLTGNALIGGAVEWFTGDSISILVVAAPILLWPRESYVLRSRPLETVVILAGAVVLSFVGFLIEGPPSITILPVLAWAALRLSVIGAALVGAIVAFIGDYATASNQGLIAQMNVPVSDRLAVTQVFIAVQVVVAMIIAQEVLARTSAVRERDVAQAERLRVESLSTLGQQLAAALTPQDIAVILERAVLDDIGASSLTVGLLNGDGSQLEYVAATRNPPLVSPESIGTDAVSSARPIIIGTIDGYRPRSDAESEWIRINGIQSLAAWPLFSVDSPIGVLLLGWSGPQPFTPEVLAYLSAVPSSPGRP